MKEIQPIDYELIRDLRRRGLFDEATALINGFHNSVKQEKEQLSKEIRSVDRKKKVIKGLCATDCCKNKHEPNKSKCTYHLKYDTEKNKKSRLRAKLPNNPRIITNMEIASVKQEWSEANKHLELEFKQSPDKNVGCEEYKNNKTNKELINNDN